MLYLNDIVSYLPAGRKSIAELSASLEMPAQSVTVYQKVYGLQNIALAEDEPLEEMLDQALARIVPSATADRARIRYIFHCHAAPCVAPSGTQLLARLKKRHGLQHAVSAGLAQDQCATPLTALSVAEALLHQEVDDAQILLLSGELSFHPRLRVIPNTTVIGDASAACLVGKRGARNAVISVAQRKFKLAAVQNPATLAIPVPATSYGDDLLDVVRDALSQAKLGIEDIRLILVHNVNAISWKFFARNYPCSPDLLYLDNVAKNGHCFTADPFINYCDAVQQGRLSPGDHFMMVSVGTSSSFAAAVLRH